MGQLRMLVTINLEIDGEINMMTIRIVYTYASIFIIRCLLRMTIDSSIHFVMIPLDFMFFVLRISNEIYTIVQIVCRETNIINNWV